jgi:hypothetical protein
MVSQFLLKCSLLFDNSIFLMAGVARALSVLTALCWESLLERCYAPQPFVSVLLDQREFENCFKDSGY